MNPASAAAYHGPGWSERTGTLADDVRTGLWASYAVNSEYSRLKSVALYTPGADVAGVDDPNAALHLRALDPSVLSAEHNAIARTYERHGVEVHSLARDSAHRRRLPNLLFARDLFWQTTAGAVVSRMAHPVRAGEERVAQTMLAALGVPIALTVGGAGLFEGADCLWLTPELVLFGLGRRSNRAAFDQIAAMLALQGVACRSVAMPPNVQHLLGWVQIVARDLVLVRGFPEAATLVPVIEGEGVEVRLIDDCEDIAERQAFNFVTVAPRAVIMAEDAPQFRRTLAEHGIEVADVVPVSQYRSAAGGLACATGVIARDLVTGPSKQVRQDRADE